MSDKSDKSSLKKSDSISEQDIEKQDPIQDGDSIENKEIYKQAWSKKLLVSAYTVLFLTAFVETFAGDSTSGLDSYATSEFDAHSLISTAAVVHKITAIVSYPIFAKINDLVGRSEGFGLAILLYCFAYVLFAACKNVQTYVCAEIFFSVGKIGYRVFQQIFIADTTSLINRGAWSQFPDAAAAVPALYVGSVIQDAFIDHSTWRWGYGVWAIIMFVSCIILTVMMRIIDKKAKQTGEDKIYKSLQGLPEGNIFKKIFYFLFIKLDLFGGALMLVGLVLFFVPLTLTGTSSTYKWHEARLIAMLVVGVVIFSFFIIWNVKIAKYPFVPKQTFLNSSVVIACLLMGLDWCVNSAFAQYMKTVLQVSKYVSVGEATRIDNSKKVCLQIFSVIGGFAMKYTKKSKIFIVLGIPFSFFGHCLLVHFINTDGGVADRGLLYMAEVFIGVGRGFSQCALQVIVQGIAGYEGIAMSTAFLLACTSIGSLIGTCISGGIWNTIVLRKLNKYLPKGVKAKKVYKNIKVALKYKKGTEARDAIAQAYRETQQLIGWVTVGILAVTIILCLFIANIKLTDHIDVYQESDDEITLDKTNRVEVNIENAEQEVGQTPAPKIYKEKLFKEMTRKEKFHFLIGW